MELGPLLFATPLALLGLIGLPLLWFVLRATPPQPKEQSLPSFALFEDMPTQEETPDKTPWWIILLRMLIALLAIIGLATPIWSPVQSADESGSNADLLLLIDDGWTAASDWSQIEDAAIGTLNATDRDRGVYLLSTTQSDYTDALATRLSPQNARAQVQAMQPHGWQPDYTRLADALGEIKDASFDIVWISDGQRSEGFDALASTLTSLGNVDVIPVTSNAVTAITSVATRAAGPVLTLTRSDTEGEQSVSAVAYDATGRSVASARGAFASGEGTTEIAFEVPDSLQTSMAWFRLSNPVSAGGVWQWEGASRLRRVGLLSEGQSLQPLLSDTYYVRNALSPFSSIVEGTLDELLEEDLNVLILTDVGELAASDASRLRSWVEGGGVLVRFAGPRLAAQADNLLPVRLRRASRALDSALSWDTPQALAGFSETGPFAALNVDSDDVLVRRQVLAQPDPQLASRTWARLADGTPLVTSAGLGEGRITLFHVTAGPEWSDLPLSGVFVDMLRYATLPARDLANSGLQPNTSLAPQRWLNGYGDFMTPAPNAMPIQIDATELPTPSAEHPAGLYEGSAVTLPLNTGASWTPAPVGNWPNGMSVRSIEDRAAFPLGGLFLGAALALLMFDLLLSLFLAGRLRFGRAATSAVFLSIGLLAFTPQTADAQDDGGTEPTREDRIMQAALELSFAYLQTDDSAANTKAESGLRGLSMVLYQRTTVEPAAPVGLNLATDPLNLFPFILVVMPEGGIILDDAERVALSQYLRNGGALVIDTGTGGSNSAQDSNLSAFLEGLDVPPLVQVSDDHVLTRSFYLVDGFYGRYTDRPLWIESNAVRAGDERRGDGISSIFITDADMVAAWAVDERGRPLFSVDGGNRNRELAFRSGVNIVMYILTGNYKEDQVHLPSLLERLGETLDSSDILRSLDDAAPRDLTPDGGDKN